MSDESSSTARIVGQTIAEGLRRKQMSQGELARRLGVDPSTISLYVKGEINIGVETVTRIARELDLQPDQLITGNLEHSCTGPH